ncbi:hypothetical protein FQN50_009464 [Emmonsiellopsis sp. PD_5]|nr:hypothetical protein FQN50_009464 [Emmonsiellopsis sp. PD_5]
MVYCSTWSKYGYFRPGYDFAGAVKFQKPLRNPLRSMANEGFAHLASTSGVQMGFTQPYYTSNGFHDWRSLYFAVNDKLRGPHESASLRNRQRIWKIASENASLVCLHLCGTHLQGIPTSWEPFSKHANQQQSKSIVTSEIQAKDSEQLLVGGRQIFIRRLSSKPSQQSICAVAITTIVFNSRRFVSGLRLFFGDEIADAHEGHCLGYVAANSEVLIRVLPENFAGFELAVCANGITAMRVLTTLACPYDWVGDNGQAGPDVAFGTLRIDTSFPFDIAASFDAFKMVAMAAINLEPSDIATMRMSEYRGLVSQPLWTPSCPIKLPLSYTPENLDYQTFNPILNMDFLKGSNDANSPNLSRIVAHMRNRRGALHGFVGLAFDLDSQTFMFGRQGDIEVSFLIDAVRGERISHVTYEQASTSYGIWSLHVRTNAGNEIRFVPDEFTASRPGELGLLTYPGQKSEAEYTHKCLPVPNGEVVTGFLSILEAGNGTFQTFDMRTTPISDSTPLTAKRKNKVYGGYSTAKLCSSLGSHIIGGGHVSHTAASLVGLRCIRFSSGSSTRPRDTNEISGLWLEYFEQPSEIVGQWLMETDSMSLEEDETIRALSFWISKSGFCFSEKTPLGRVIRISVLTSKREKTVCMSEPLSPDNYIELNFRENRLEYLTSIAWAFTGSYDHPRVDSSSSANDSIQLWHPQNFLSTLKWVVPEKVLWEDRDSDRVVSVAAYDAPVYKIHYISGLLFTYKSGMTRRIGRPLGELTKAITCSDYERISHLEVLYGRYGLLKITFHFQGPGGNLGSREPRSLSSSSYSPESINSIEPSVCHDYIDLSSSLYRLYIIEQNNSRESDQSKQQLPDKEVIGLWGAGFNTEQKLEIGVIFGKDH